MEGRIQAIDPRFRFFAEWGQKRHIIHAESCNFPFVKPHEILRRLHLVCGGPELEIVAKVQLRYTVPDPLRIFRHKAAFALAEHLVQDHCR